MTDEQRGTPRQKVLKTGAIEFGGGVIDCTVRNLSASGAALDVVSPVGIPERFTLFVPADDVRKQCKVAWRREGRIGVSFLS